MTTLVRTVVENYNYLFTDKRDPRVDGWFLMDSPFPTLALCVTYVYIVKVLGPWFMKDRPPYEFRKTLIVYNFIQVLFSIWIFVELGFAGWFGHYSLRCEPVDYSDSPFALRFGMGGWFRGYSFTCQPIDYSSNEMAIRMVYASWWYYFSKFTEFFDTFFFVLRKKDQHVSTLHVIHHGVMPMSVWFGVKFTPGGHSTFFGLLNSFVHIIMYFYYMMTAMGPQYQKYLWWKKHLTTLQMIQFVAIFSHSFQLCFVNCDYPRAFMWWIGGHAVLFFFLFAEFYKKSYQNRKSVKSKDIISSIVPCVIHENDNTNISNGHTKMTNGYANGNGHANGHTNGYANGHANGKTNGHANGKTNGHANGKLNGHTHGSGKPHGD